MTAPCGGHPPALNDEPGLRGDAAGADGYRPGPTCNGTWRGYQASTPDGLVFTNQAGGPVHPSAYSRAFGQAKQVALPASSPLRRSQPVAQR